MSGTTDELSKVPTASNNEEDLISEMLSQQNISNNENDVSVCTNCGKEGSNMNICNTNVRRPSIAMLHARKSTDQSIRNNVRGV